jgi:hypothetical protein
LRIVIQKIRQLRMQKTRLLPDRDQIGQALGGQELPRCVDNNGRFVADRIASICRPPPSIGW